MFLHFQPGCKIKDSEDGRDSEDDEQKMQTYMLL